MSLQTLRRTKIIATLGPAVDQDGMLEKIIKAGVNLVRINMSHGSYEEHQKRIDLTRSIARSLNKSIGILIDLQGPKIRIARFKEGPIQLTNGQRFILDAEFDTNSGNKDKVGIDYKALPQDVKIEDILLLDDGRITLKVKNINKHIIECVVIQGGELSNNKGINRQGGGLTAEALTDKDKQDMQFAAKMKADYVAISFPRCAKDIQQARLLLNEAGSFAALIAKIERTEAIEALEEIIEYSDAVMVARGDLGVEIGYAEVPSVQKMIIKRARNLDKVVITATQMMESMITNSIPTRAEVSDVANAVIDGTDAVMLSAETATGLYPDKVVEIMSGICLAAERERSTQVSGHRLESRFSLIDEAIAMAAMYTANHINTKAIIAFTETGSTPLWMSRISSGIPIFGLTPQIKTVGKMTLFRGVYPLEFNADKFTRSDDAIYEAIQLLIKKELIQKNDKIIITFGKSLFEQGGTNVLKLVTV
ncbi:MAG: pyk [Francisellaceae bacterium]|nr:pyk [Francisellaceae bacterium]